MEERYLNPQLTASLIRITFVVAVFVMLNSITIAQQKENQVVEATNNSSGINTNIELENKKYELEKRKVEIEVRRLADARTMTLITAGSVVVPLFLGFMALFLQSRTAYKLKEMEANVAFKLQAAEIIMASTSTRAAEQRADALHRLFPKQITNEFVEIFKQSTFTLPGMAYQGKKMELFKMLAGNLENRREVFRAYAMLYSDEDHVLTDLVDKWSKLYPEDKTWIEEFKQQWLKVFPKGRWIKPSTANPSKSSGADSTK